MGKIRVVLIEDEELTRVGLRTALQQHREIEWMGEADNGAQGLQLLAMTQADLAIVDIGLPDMTGIELTQRYKASLTDEQEPATRIVILTFHNDSESVLAAFAAGADSYCMKDIRLDLLLEAIKTTHEGNAWIDPAIARIVLSHATTATEETTPRLIQSSSANPLAPNYRQLLADHPLTERELQVLQLIVDGCSNAEIADTLFITVGTVKTHVRNILNKLCADDRTQAAVRALRTGLVG